MYPVRKNESEVSSVIEKIRWTAEYYEFKPRFFLIFSFFMFFNLKLNK